jgi:hypothetical protein
MSTFFVDLIEARSELPLYLEAVGWSLPPGRISGGLPITQLLLKKLTQRKDPIKPPSAAIVEVILFRSPILTQFFVSRDCGDMVG